ncbi:hypothetical protein DPMN_153672, partial [Dreissena polymorpha]
IAATKVTQLTETPEGGRERLITVQLARIELCRKEVTKLNNKSITLPLKGCVKTYAVKTGHLTRGQGHTYTYGITTPDLMPTWY